MTDSCMGMGSSGIDFWWDVLGVKNVPNKDHKECSVCHKTTTEGKFIYNGVYGDDIDVPMLDGPVCSDHCMEIAIQDALTDEHIFTAINALELLRKKINIHLHEIDDLNEAEGSDPIYTLTVFMEKIGKVEDGLRDISEAVRYLKDALKVGA